MPLSPEELAQLAAAQSALTKVEGGEAVKSIAHGSKRMETHAPDAAALQRRVDRLEAKSLGRRLRGAIGFRI